MARLFHFYALSSLQQAATAKLLGIDFDDADADFGMSPEELKDIMANSNGTDDPDEVHQTYIATDLIGSAPTLLTECCAHLWHLFDYRTSSCDRCLSWESTAPSRPVLC